MSKGSPRLPSGPPEQPEEEIVTIQIQVPVSFRRELRVEAAQRDLTISQLVQEAFQSRMRMIKRP